MGRSKDMINQSNISSRKKTIAKNSFFGQECRCLFVHQLAAFYKDIPTFRISSFHPLLIPRWKNISLNSHVRLEKPLNSFVIPPQTIPLYDPEWRAICSTPGAMPYKTTSHTKRYNSIISQSLFTCYVIAKHITIEN